VVLSWYSGFFLHYNWSPWYSWNIAESGIKHNKSNQIKSNHLFFKYTIWLSFIVLYLLSPSWSYGSWIYNYLCNQCLSPLKLWVQISWGELNTTLCDEVWQWLVAGQWFSPSTLVSSINKTDCRDIAEILFEVAINTITPLYVLSWEVNHKYH